MIGTIIALVFFGGSGICLRDALAWRRDGAGDCWMAWAPLWCAVVFAIIGVLVLVFA